MKITTIFALVLSISAGWPQQAAPLDQIRRDLIAQYPPRPEPLIPVHVVSVWDDGSADHFCAAIRTELVNSRRYSVTLDPQKPAVQSHVITAATFETPRGESMECFAVVVSYRGQTLGYSRHVIHDQKYPTAAAELLSSFDRLISAKIHATFD